MKKSFISALLFGALLSFNGWAMEDLSLNTVLGAKRVSNLRETLNTLARYGVEDLDSRESVQSWCDLVQVMIDPSQLPALLSDLRAIGTEGVGAGAPVSASASAAPESLEGGVRAPDPARTETLVPTIDVRAFLESIASYDESARTKAIEAWFRETWSNPGGDELLLAGLQEFPELDISTLFSATGRISHANALKAYQHYFSMVLPPVAEGHVKEGEDTAGLVSAAPSHASVTLEGAITRTWSTTKGMQEVLKALKSLPGIDEACLASISIGVSDVLEILAHQPPGDQESFLQKIVPHMPMPAVSAEEGVGHGAGRGMVTSRMIMTGEDLKSLNEAGRIHRETPQDTDVHLFNRQFSAEAINTISKLANTIITEQGLELVPLATLAGLTENTEAKAILTGSNINGSDDESGGVSLHAGTEVQEAYALAAFVDGWEHAGRHRFADSTGTEVAGDSVGFLFHKLSENVATGGGCTAGIRGRATEVKLICLNILRDKGFFRIG